MEDGLKCVGLFIHALLDHLYGPVFIWSLDMSNKISNSAFSSLQSCGLCRPPDKIQALDVWFESSICSTLRTCVYQSSAFCSCLYGPSDRKEPEVEPVGGFMKQTPLTTPHHTAEQWRLINALWIFKFLFKIPVKGFFFFSYSDWQLLVSR